MFTESPLINGSIRQNIKNINLMECDTVKCGKSLSMFRRNVLFPSSGSKSKRINKRRAEYSFARFTLDPQAEGSSSETSINFNQNTQCRISEASSTLVIDTKVLTSNLARHILFQSYNDKERRMPSSGMWRRVCVVWTDVSEPAATCSRWFLVHGFLYPEDGGDIFFRNVGSHKIYSTPRLRRLHSS
jgi:hypothetical protein